MLPIGNPDPILKKILRKKNIYSKANMWVLIGTEIVEREYIICEATLIVNAACKEASIILLSSPLQASKS